MVWGEHVVDRHPSRDEGAWCAFKVTAGGPNGANVGRVMWYNKDTHEHKWQQPNSPAERTRLVQVVIDAKRAQVADIEHKDTTEIVHSIVFPDRTIGDVPLMESSVRYDDEDEGWMRVGFLFADPKVWPDRAGCAFGDVYADACLLKMRRDIAEKQWTDGSDWDIYDLRRTIACPTDEATLEMVELLRSGDPRPGVLWRSCIQRTEVQTLSGGMAAYAADRVPRSRFCDHRDPKNGTHADVISLRRPDHYIVKPVWKKDSPASKNTKVWRCTVREWTEAHRRLLHELARGWCGWGACELALRGDLTVGKALPAVKRGALRVKGFPWSTKSTEGISAWRNEMSYGPGSVLEGLFVFDDNKRAGTLEREVLGAPAEWTPVKFDVWEEEVWHFGLYDVVFERDAAISDGEIRDALFRAVSKHDKRVGERVHEELLQDAITSASPSGPQLHAILLMQCTCYVEWLIADMTVDEVAVFSLPPVPPTRELTVTRVSRIVRQLRDAGELHFTLFGRPIMADHATFEVLEAYDHFMNFKPEENPHPESYYWEKFARMADQEWAYSQSRYNIARPVPESGSAALMFQDGEKRLRGGTSASTSADAPLPPPVDNAGEGGDEDADCLADQFGDVNFAEDSDSSDWEDVPISIRRGLLALVGGE